MKSATTTSPNAQVLRRWPMLLVLALAACFCLAGTLPVAAQLIGKGRPKYVPIPIEGDPKIGLQELLEEFKDKKQANQNLVDFLKKFQDSKEKITADELKGILKHPLVQEKLKQALDNPNDLKDLPLDQKKKEEFKELLKDKDISDLLKKQELPKEKTDPKPTDPPKQPDQPPEPPSPPPGPDTPSQTQESEETEDLLGKWLDSMMESSGNSEFTKMLMESKEFRKFFMESDWFGSDSKQKLPGLDSPQLGKWLEKLPKLEWKNPDIGTPNLKLGKLNLPPLPKLNLKLPNLGAPAVSVAAPSLSTGGVVLIVAMLAGVIVIVGLLARGSRWIGAGRKGKWHPGPWPVDPTRINTRGELVRAFDYLALLLLGRQAEHLHHNDIAAQTPGALKTSEALGQTAAQLARKYEQARYAPAEEDLSAEDMRQARAELWSLAGAARA